MAEITDRTESWLETTAALDAEIFPESPWGIDMFRQNIRNPYDHPVVALEEGIPVAYGILRQIDDGEVLLVGVREEDRRKGLGRRVVSELLKRAEPGKNIFLEVRDSNRAARHLYESAGFKEISRRKNYYKDPQEDAVIMMISYA